MNIEPGPSNIPDSLQDAQPVSLPKGMRVFTAGDACTQFFYLLAGSIRVDLIAKTGRTIALYRFGAGQTCILTTSCLLSGEDYCAEAIVEEDVSALVLPQSTFRVRLSQSAPFRDIVFSSFAERLTAMMGKIEEVAFSPLDQRLAKWILKEPCDEGLITTTHDQIAADLGTAREVVSRKLSAWERQGLVERSRGTLRILERGAISRLSQSDNAALGD